MLSSFISPAVIKTGMESSEKEEGFAELLELLVAKNPKLDRKEAMEALVKREEKMSTAVLPFVAVPHALCSSAGDTLVAMGISREGIEFEAPDPEADKTRPVVNIIFDALFIIVLKWGVMGAALATVLGHISNCTIGIYFYVFSKKNYFVLDFKEGIHIKWGYMLQVVLIGLSSAILNICNFVSTIVYNNVIGKYSNALSILAILTSLDALCIMPCVGVRQGLLPIFGYNYGEKKYERMFKIYGVGVIYGLFFGITMCLTIMSFPNFFINLFVSGEETQELIVEATRILKFYPIGITIISINMNTSALYQATRAKFKASLLSLMRQCLYLIPLLYILDSLYSEAGVWYAMPISDFLSSLTGLMLFLATFICYKKCGYLSIKDLKNSKLREEHQLV